MDDEPVSTEVEDYDAAHEALDGSPLMRSLWAEAMGEEDDRYSRFVGEKYPLGEVHWGLFSMNALVRTPDFVQAAA